MYTERLANSVLDLDIPELYSLDLSSGIISSCSLNTLCGHVDAEQFCSLFGLVRVAIDLQIRADEAIE
jgi:hypothetical protein